MFFPMPNALIHETSPYLLQHADNPVEWLPWGDDVFRRAAEENKMVFLSVGYSTCHWCHVMERESFENEAAAAVINRFFINVKVDREERPDVDAAYMAFVQATTGQGGWPMSVWLTPEGKPVFGGTYFPPADGHGRPGFTRVCHELARLWRDDRDALRASAAEISTRLREMTSARPTAPDQETPSTAVFATFAEHCAAMFDAEEAGFGGAPKFPRPVLTRAILQISDHAKTEAEQETLRKMALATLDAMARGGIRDHLGGGFHRYSVDRFWHVPHFEKMLYDQAQLAVLYLEGWQITRRGDFREVAEEIYTYLLGRLRDATGAFHAAEDADSLPEAGAAEKREGAYWTWNAAEISRLLEPRAAAVFSAAYGVEHGGNARPSSDPHGELTGVNTLSRAFDDAELSEKFGADAPAILVAAKAVLLEKRSARPAPHRDDKLVTAWNGMALTALAKGARILGRGDLAAAAENLAAFLRSEMWDGSRLFRSFRQHRSSTPGFPADYAAVIEGLLELYGISSSGGWLAWAMELQAALEREYGAPHGYEMAAPRTGLWSMHDDHDGAEPAASHVAIGNLLKLAALTGDAAFSNRAGEILAANSAALAERSFSAPVLLAAYDLHQRGIAKYSIGTSADEILCRKISSAFLPAAVFERVAGPEAIVCEGMRCRKISADEFSPAPSNG